jgi:hypothetical protein
MRDFEALLIVLFPAFEPPIEAAMALAAYDQHSALLNPIAVPIFASSDAASQIINEKGFLCARWAKDHRKGAFLDMRFNQPDRRRHIVQTNALKKRLFFIS